MIQDQLTDYIASQIKLGVSRDGVKTALVGVGWAAQDVEDTLKKVEGGASATPAIVTAAATSMTGVGVGASSASPAVSSLKPITISIQPQSQQQPTTQQPAQKPAASQNIRVSDLVSASFGSGSGTGTGVATGSGTTSASTAKISPMSTSANASMNTMQAKMSVAPSGMGEAPKKGMGKSAYIMIGLILILAGLSAYLFFQNGTLSSQLQTSGAGGAADGSAAQVASLTGQVQQLTASSTALTAQIANLTMQVAELQADLSFFMVPTGQAAGVPVSVTVSGVLSGSKAAYLLTTLEGVKVAIKNSTNADVQAALQPLIGTTTSPVQISGTHIPGIASITVVVVNGQPVTKPVAAPATSTATSTSMTATSTTSTSTQESSSSATSSAQ